jgi:hypothetical protein
VYLWTVYVKVVHVLWLSLVFCGWSLCSICCFNFCNRFCGKLFSVDMCCIILHSFCFFSAVSGRRCILVMWYLKAAVLCSKGLLDWKLIVVSVVVGFLYISILRCGGFRFMLKSGKFMFPFSSCVGLSFMLLCIWFMWVSMSLGCILLESYITYLPDYKPTVFLIF